MIHATHNGCKVTVKAGRGRDWSHIFATVNGAPVPVAEGQSIERALAEVTCLLDMVHAAPIDGDRWPPHYYAPGTYELCDSETHPREVGGVCTHSWCRKNGQR